MTFSDPDMTSVAMVIGEPARAKMLWALLDGRAYTATEQALFADVSPQTGSMHLGKLVDAQFLTVERQGRYKYYRFANDDVAFAIEAIANLAKPAKHQENTGQPVIQPIKYCRTCYDHLAGKVGVALTQSLISMGAIEYSNNEFTDTVSGDRLFQGLGIDIEVMKAKKRIMARPCLDWSERKLHLAGSLGSALLEHFLVHDWVRRTKDSRVIIITSIGKRQLYDTFRIDLTQVSHDT